MSNPLSIQPGAHDHLMWRVVLAELQLYWIDRRLGALLAQDDDDEDCGSYYTAQSSLSLESWQTARSRLSATSAGHPTPAGKSLSFFITEETH